MASPGRRGSLEQHAAVLQQLSRGRTERHRRVGPGLLVARGGVTAPGKGGGGRGGCALLEAAVEGE